MQNVVSQSALDAELAREPLEVAMTRAQLRVRGSQMVWTLPAVIASLVAIDIALRERVDGGNLRLWAFILSGTMLLRSVYFAAIFRKVATASQAKLKEYELRGSITGLFNGIAMGLSFWLVAAHGDLEVKLVITLVNCFFAIATIVNASRYFPLFILVTAVHLGQGILFWLGIGSDERAHFDIAIPMFGVTLLTLAFAKTNARQVIDSLAIRTENLHLLEQLAAEKKLVERALDQARIASESKSRFLAAASHDLRQPLHALTMFLGTLTFHVTTDDAKRLLGRVKDTTDVLRDQFDSLLDISKFDADAVQPDIASFDLAALVHKVVEEMRQEAEAKKLSISAVADAGIARSDAILVERVLRNLLANAVKYTNSGAVTVSVRRGGDEFEVEVIDTGPGIAVDQQSRIFEEYVQLKNPARQRHHGVGLGLAIVKRIDSLLGLQLKLRSSPGEGSRFSFCVPASTDTLQQTLRRDVDVTNFRTTDCIWVLDDDPTILDGFREQLSAWGATVETFPSPEALIERLRVATALPHWILSDDMLGSALSGLDTARLLSREFGFGRVCLITGNTEPQRLAELRASGFPVIIKPMRSDALVAILSR